MIIKNTNTRWWMVDLMRKCRPGRYVARNGNVDSIFDFLWGIILLEDEYEDNLIFIRIYMV